MELHNKTVAILGGTGKMGKWFVSFFRSKGARVIVWGRDSERTMNVSLSLGVCAASSFEDAVKDKDLILVATSIDSAPAIIRSAASYANPQTLICDIASLKEEVVGALKDAAKLGLKAVSIHPMFGPAASGFAGHKVMLIPVSDDESATTLKNLFEGEGAQVHVVKSAELHDRMSALTLGLPHFLNMTLGMMLLDEDIAELKKFSGTTFGLQLLISQTVLNENPSQYAQIQIRNPHFLSVLETLEEAIDKLQTTVRNKDQDGFVKIFQRIRDRYSRDPQFREACAQFYRAWTAASAKG